MFKQIVHNLKCVRVFFPDKKKDSFEREKLFQFGRTIGQKK